MVNRRTANDATTVIVADDDEDQLSLVAAALRDDGYVVQEAHDGAELIHLLVDPTSRPDVVVTDVKMPGLSGLGVLHELHRAGWSIPVVVMTGLSDDSIRRVARQMGAVGVLRKPFDPDDLLTAVCNARMVHAQRNETG